MLSHNLGGWFTVSHIVWAVCIIIFFLVVRNGSKSITYYCEITSLKDVRRIGNKLLVVRGVDDEASLTLAFGAIINRLTGTASRFLYLAVAILLIPWLTLFAAHAIHMLSGARRLTR